MKNHMNSVQIGMPGCEKVSRFHINRTGFELCFHSVEMKFCSLLAKLNQIYEHKEIKLIKFKGLSAKENTFGYASIN